MMLSEALKLPVQPLGRHYGWTLLDSSHRDFDTESCKDLSTHVPSRLKVANISPLDVSLTPLKRDTGGIGTSKNDTILMIAFVNVIEC